MLPIIQTIFKLASRVITLVPALAVSWWTNVLLGSCSVLRIAIFDVAPPNPPEFDPHSPGCGGCLSVMCWCGSGEENATERKGEALRTIKLASCEKGINSSQHDRYTQDESC